MNEKNEKPDKRFLIVVLVFGLAATGASIHWLNSGEIAMRSAAAEGATEHGGRIVGEIAGDRVLFYPISIAWALLGVTMIALSGLAFVRNEPMLLKLSANDERVFSERAHYDLSAEGRVSVRSVQSVVDIKELRVSSLSKQK